MVASTVASRGLRVVRELPDQTWRKEPLVLEGEAHRVTEASTLERVAAVYRTGG